MHRSLEDQSGAVAVLVAILMVPLIAMAALAIDLGMLVNERRNVQIAVDQAALGAAWADCNGNNPTAAGQSIGSANGFAGTSITADGDGFRADVSSTIDTGFANVFGVSSMTTEARATAECRLIPEALQALFAGSDDPSCDPTLSWIGSSGTITGDIHSNDDLDIIGSGNTVDGSATYVDEENVSPGNPNIDTAPASRKEIPQFDVDDYAPGGDIWNDATDAGMNRSPSNLAQNITLNNGSQNGLYYTTGNITGNTALNNKRFTLVSNGGVIRLNGNGQTLTRWDETNQLLAFATDGDCENEVIQRIGSGGVGSTPSSWTGILYAPNGQIRLSGTNLPTVTGALIAATLDIQGNQLSVDASDLVGPPVPTVRLIE